MTNPKHRSLKKTNLRRKFCRHSMAFDSELYIVSTDFGQSAELTVVSLPISITGACFVIWGGDGASAERKHIVCCWYNPKVLSERLLLICELTLLIRISRFFCPTLTINGQLNREFQNVTRHDHAGEDSLIVHSHFCDDETEVIFQTDSGLVVHVVWNGGILTSTLYQYVAFVLIKKSHV